MGIFRVTCSFVIERVALEEIIIAETTERGKMIYSWLLIFVIIEKVVFL